MSVTLRSSPTDLEPSSVHRLSLSISPLPSFEARKIAAPLKAQLLSSEMFWSTHHVVHAVMEFGLHAAIVTKYIILYHLASITVL